MLGRIYKLRTLKGLQSLAFNNYKVDRLPQFLKKMSPSLIEKPDLRLIQHINIKQFSSSTKTEEDKYLQLGKQLKDSGNLKAALNYFDEVLKINNQNLEALLNRGKILIEQNQHLSAEKSFQIYIQLKPEDSEGYYYKGLCLIARESYDEAYYCFDTSVTLGCEKAKEQMDLCLVPADTQATQLDRGERLLQENKQSEALLVIDETIQLFPKLASAHFLKGVALLNLEKYEQAVDCFLISDRLYPDHPPVYQNLGACFRRLKKYKEVLFYLEKSMRLQPDYHDGYAIRGDMLYELQNFDEALQNYKFYLEKKPDDTTYQYRLIRSLVKKGENINEAKLRVDQYLTKAPHDPGLLFQKALIFQKEDQKEEAISLYDYVIKLDPNWPDPYFNKASCLHSLGKIDESIDCVKKLLEISINDPEALGLLVQLLKMKNRFQEAVVVMKELIKLSPEDHTQYYKLASILSMIGNNKDATLAMEEALKRAPTKKSEYFYLYAMNLYNTGNPEKALIEIDQTINLNSKLVDAYRIRGNILLTLKRYSEAIEMYRQYLSLETVIVKKDALKNIGIAFIRNEQWHEGVNQLEKYLKESPDDIAAHFYRAVACYSLTNYQDSIDSLNIYLKQYPQELQGFYQRGQAYAMMGKFKEALSDLDMCLILDKFLHDYYFHYLRGYSLLKVNQPEDALVSLEQSLKIEQNNILGWHDKGLALNSLDRQGEAILCFNKIIKAKPTFFDVYLNKGIALYYLKRYQEALECIDKCLEIKPDSKEAQSHRTDILSAMKQK